jgi:hypothetical protein
MRVLVVICILAAAAHADPPGMTTLAPVAPNDLDQLARSDAASDRGFAFDSGLVLGRGDVDVSLRSLLEHGSNLGLGVGLGGGVALSIDGTDGLGGRYESLGGGVRVRIARGPRYEFSLATGYHWASQGADTIDQPFSGGYLTVGGDLAIAVNDRLLMSFGLGAARYTGDGDSTTGFYGHADLVVGASWLRMLVEVGDVGSPFAVVGARLATAHVSVDLGVGASSDELVDSASAVVVFAVSVRP